MKRFLKFLGIAVLAIVVLVAVAAIFFMSRSSSRMEQRFDVRPAVSVIEADSAALARGRHLAVIEACGHCHGENLGGAVMMDMPLWRMPAPNLTRGRGGLGTDYSIADWDRAIRGGVGKDGRALMIMPSEVYKNLSDQDAAALIAYLRTVPNVDNELPERKIRLLGNIMLGAGNFDPASLVHDPGAAPATTPAHEPTEEFGAYVASTTCIGCHGENFGGKEPDNPDCPASPPLNAAGAWELPDFVNTMRTGVNPGGRELLDQCMPWTHFGRMTDTELQALHKYIRATTG